MDELEIVRHRRIDGISLFLDSIGYRTSHFHDEWELIWVLDGKMSLNRENKSLQIAQGEIVLLNPRCAHEMWGMDGGCTFLCLQIAPGRFKEIGELSVEDPITEDYLSPEEGQQLRQYLFSAAGSYFRGEKFFALECMGYIGLALHILMMHLPSRKLDSGEAENRSKRNARLIRLQQFVDSNFRHKIRLSDFAQAEGCSLSYLSHFVKESMNQTFQEYVNTVRFNYACQLIVSGKMNMLDVCMESGFSDYRYFVKTFRRLRGMTPEEYRRSHSSRNWDPAVRHSLHSLERFYSAEQSLEMLEAWKIRLLESPNKL